MAQRCSYCGRTEKQHKGVACFDVPGFTKALAELAPSRQRLEPGMRHAIEVLEQVLNRGQNGAIGAGLAIAIVELKMAIEKL